MRNYIGVAFVLVYFVLAIASAYHAATIAHDSKGQWIFLTLPITFTPQFLFNLLPPVADLSSGAGQNLLLLIRYPIGFSFSTIVLYLIGWVLQRIWLIGLAPSIVVGAIIGFIAGALGFSVAFMIDKYYSAVWFTLIPVGAALSFFLHSKLVGSQTDQQPDKRSPQ